MVDVRGAKGMGYPTTVLLVGAIVTVVWVIALEWVRGIPDDAVVHALTSGMIGAAGGSLAALILSFIEQPDLARLDRVAHDARHDALTGLANRAELFRILDESILQADADDMVLGVLFLDLDRFKLVNDAMGHEAGDELLKIVAERLRSTIRNTDVVARLGGDEFVIICRDLLSADSVVGLAEQILKRFRDPVALGSQEHRIGTSIGIAIALPGHDRGADELVSDADAAMYRAKETKSGYAVFDDAHRLQVIDRMDIEHDLQRALENQELVVHYQPIVDVSTKSLYGFEALVRWDHPERGLLSPADFIPIASDAGMMTRLGELVLREACAQAAVWNHTAPAAKDVRMSVNLAEQQLADTTLPKRVADILSWAGLPSDQLVLEITEDVIVDHLDSLDSLRQLHMLGIELSIDDFGTGQSSLGYVKQFDMVTTLKIDKRFITDMRSGEADRAIIEAVVAMAKALDMKVVAEGVEYEDQVRDLQDFGVNLMQGYLFNSAVGADLIDPEVWFPSGDSQNSEALGASEVQLAFVRTLNP